MAWKTLGASPLLVDSGGSSARSLLDCHLLHEWGAASGKPFKDCILVHDGRAAIVAIGCPAGDATVVTEAVGQGYRELIFDAGEMHVDDDVPINAMIAQEVLLLASPTQLETVYMLLKGLDQVRSPARIWLLWNGECEESKRLMQVCNERLHRSPCFLDEATLSRSGHASKRNGLSTPLQDNDFLGIVTRMVLKRSVGGEETPCRTKCHA